MTVQFFVLKSQWVLSKIFYNSKPQVLQRYKDLCCSLYLPQDLYDLEFKTKNDKLHMYFRKNHYRISRHLARFGKNIIISSHQDWHIFSYLGAKREKRLPCVMTAEACLS